MTSSPQGDPMARYPTKIVGVDGGLLIHVEARRESVSFIEADTHPECWTSRF